MWVVVVLGVLVLPWLGNHAIQTAAAGAGSIEACGVGQDPPPHGAREPDAARWAAVSGFSTQQLDCVLESSRIQGSAGVIYVWSPHMPLSVKGLPEAASVAGALQVTFIPALDPYADPRSVRQLLEAGTVSPEETSRATADALAQRGMFLHFPSLLVFVDGRLRGPSWPGYHRPVVLEHYLRTRLK